ncbi:MAG: Hsp20/alpha crystallin family protein [Cyclobacteriaceae bacterium]|nr:Hsp20/alpha crystallin family protein [Cyclobacteriaceae bacterium]
MALIKRSGLPSLLNEGWLTDFFDSSRFFDTDWMKRMQVVPAVNVLEKDKAFEIEVAAPGLEKKDFNITVDNGVLTISCEKETEKEDKDKNYTRREYSYTNFARSFTLPDSVKGDDISAKYDNGILRITLPKTEEARVKSKAIKVD